MRAFGDRGITRKELIVSVAIIGVLLAAAIPTLTTTVQCGCVAKSLSHAKQIYLGLIMFAGDHNGAFPHARTDEAPFTNANEAYRNLIPDYVATEELFSIPDSTWTPKPFDAKERPEKPLLAGRNHWAYLPNITDTSIPHLPLVAEGFKKGTPGVYDAQSTHVHKGRNKGRIARAVIRADGAGKFEFASNEDYRIYDSDETGKKFDIFKPAPGWLRPDQAPLNPEG